MVRSLSSVQLVQDRQPGLTDTRAVCRAARGEEKKISQQPPSTRRKSCPPRGLAEPPGRPAGPGQASSLSCVAVMNYQTVGMSNATDYFLTVERS